jgi:hypothetical protein
MGVDFGKGSFIDFLDEWSFCSFEGSVENAFGLVDDSGGILMLSNFSVEFSGFLSSGHE